MAQRRDRLTTRSRNYDQISDEIRQSIPELAPNWTSHGSDEPGIALTDIVAGVSDGLFFYADRVARESFLRTAVLPSSVHELAHMLHYRPKRWFAAQGEIVVNIQYTMGESEENPMESEINLPAFTNITSNRGYNLVTTEVLNIGANYQGQASVSALEGIYTTFTDTISPENLQGVLLPNQNIAEQLFEVYVDGELWYESSDHPLDSDLDRFYYIRRNDEGRYVISFRATRGRVPPYGATLEVKYLITKAENFDADLVDTVNLRDFNGIKWSHTPFTNSVGPETLQQIVDRAPANNTTSNRAVTLDDYRRLAQQIPNVKAVYVSKSKIGWNTAEVFVATLSGDVPSGELLATVRDFFSIRNNLITSVRTFPATYRPFILNLTVRPLNGFNTAKVLNDVKATLQRELAYEQLTFASPIRISDIYGIVEQVPGVDFSNITALHWLAGIKEVRNLIPSASEHPVLDLANFNVTLE